MKKNFYLLALIAALAGCSKSQKTQLKARASSRISSFCAIATSSSLISYQLVAVTEDSIAGVLQLRSLNLGMLLIISLAQVL